MTEVRRVRDLPQLAAVQCFNCLDTSVAADLYGPTLCADCGSLAPLAITPVAQRFSETVWFRQARQKTLDLQTLNIGRILVHCTSEQPIARATFEKLLSLDERKVKSVIEELRSEWVLPIGSTRHLGYYWMHKAKDFIDWSRPYKAQAITSLVTLYRMQRVNFPELAGQKPFDFIEAINEQLRESI